MTYASMDWLSIILCRVPPVWDVFRFLSKGCRFGWTAIISIGLAVAAGSPSAAQTPEYGTTYRPPEAEYVSRTSGPFLLIYQRGYDAMARQAAAELHRSHAATDSLIGGRSRSMNLPVVLNAFNDMSNGYVRPFPFKTEIELPTLRTDPLTAGFPTWTSAVGPHELVHAVHGNYQTGFGVGRVLGWLGRDLERVVNLSAPSGWTEGVAVYRESRIEPGAGRLTAPLFTMKYRAAMESSDPWSLTQMMEASAHTQPFDRHYIGGAHAFEFVSTGNAEHSGSPGTTAPDASAFASTSSMYNRFPFLGFGVALWSGTGMRLGAIRDSLRAQHPVEAAVRRPPRPGLNVETQIGRSAPGLNHRRPIWLSDEDLVVYRFGYDVRPGFFRIHAGTGNATRIATQALTEDYLYSLSADTTHLWTSRYVPDAFSPIQQRAEVEAITLPEGDRIGRTRHSRVFGAVETSTGRILAIRNDGSLSHIVERSPEGHFVARTDFSNTRFLQLSPSPTDDRVAALVNVGGEQRIYQLRQKAGSPPVATDGKGSRSGPDLGSKTNLDLLSSRSETTVHSLHEDERAVGSDPLRFNLTPWIGLRDMRIYDLSWSRDGRYLLFAAARPRPVDARPCPPSTLETPNVYAYDTQTGVVSRHTDARYGALEPALSPNGSTLAFVRYQHERFDLMTSPFQPERRILSDSLVERNASEWSVELPQRGTPSVSDIPWGAARPYRARRHLAPRMAYPLLKTDPDDTDLRTDASLPVGAGVGIQGTDPLQRWAYGLEGWVQDASLWGEGSVAFAGSVPRPSLRVFRRPVIIADQARLQETGVGVDLSMPITFASNVHQTLGRIQVGVDARQTQVTRDDRPDDPADDRLTLKPSAAFGYRLQANPRDLIPNRGLLLQGSAVHDLWTRGSSTRAQHGVVGEAVAYLPVLTRMNTGVQLRVGVVAQREGNEFGLSRFLPRGYEDRDLSDGTFLRLRAEVVQPMWYADDGMLLIPLYLKVLYAYGFGSTLTRLEDTARRGPRVSSVGMGFGARIRLFSVLDLDLRIGGAYRPREGDIVVVGR